MPKVTEEVVDIRARDMKLVETIKEAVELGIEEEMPNDDLEFGSGYGECDCNRWTGKKKTYKCKKKRMKCKKRVKIIEASDMFYDKKGDKLISKEMWKKSEMEYLLRFNSKRKRKKEVIRKMILDIARKTLEPELNHSAF
jgi:hypothetical protein